MTERRRICRYEIPADGMEAAMQPDFQQRHTIPERTRK